MTGSFHLQQANGSTVFSPPIRMTLKPNGFYIYPDIDLRAGTYTLTVAAKDNTGLIRTATAEVTSTSTAPGVCSISSPGWAYS